MDITLKLPTNYTEIQLKNRIKKRIKADKYSYRIVKKSLDARKKNNIHWTVCVAVFTKKEKIPPALSFDISFKKRKQKVVIVGSGPAGFFCAFVLQKAGFNTTLLERGSDVNKRSEDIKEFENNGVFSPVNNYAFGEGGAGTFSDGKLTSRSKHISGERQFVLSSYINAGAPKEIEYLSHPHLGSDNIKKIVKQLREMYLDIGGNLLFETRLDDLKIKDGEADVHEVITSSGDIEADYFVIAPGNSAYDTYRMLIRRNVPFRTKNFAIGSRVEHPQEVINIAQWGKKSLPGVKAAEYRITSQTGVYTFCMCPGGIIVPSSAYLNRNIVNGMSFYDRAGKFANAACVAGINLNKLTGRENTPLEALEWLEILEERFYNYSKGFRAPYCSVQDFIDKKEPSVVVESSYPLGLNPAPLWELLPESISKSIRSGLIDFSKKIKGYETGNIVGLESKTSSPIQVLRNELGLCTGFKNLYIAGEGSGYSGGIISSAADGIKTATNIILSNS